MATAALLEGKHIDHLSAIHQHGQTAIVAIGLRLEEGALHLRTETHTPQQQIDDAHEAQHTRVGMEAATEGDQGHQRGHIRLEEIHEPGHLCPELVATLDLPDVSQGRHVLWEENCRHTEDNVHHLNEKG